jgi:hypothetical protein
MIGTSTINHSGDIRFSFSDGTRAQICWRPNGVGGDGSGGGYYKSTIDFNGSKFTDDEIVTLAYWNSMSGPIRGPEELIVGRLTPALHS